MPTIIAIQSPTKINTRLPKKKKKSHIFKGRSEKSKEKIKINTEINQIEARNDAFMQLYRQLVIQSAS